MANENIAKRRHLTNPFTPPPIIRVGFTIFYYLGQCNYFQEMQECGFDIGCETQVASSSNGNIDGTHLIVNEFETWNSSTADVKLQYEWGKNGNMDNFELIANGPLGLQVVEVVAINS